MSAATTIRWFRRREGGSRLLVAESVRPWTPGTPDPATPVDPAPAPERAPDRWTAELVRARLAEAMRILRLLPDDAQSRPSTHTVRWPDVVHDLAEAYGYGRAKAAERPSPAEIGRLDETLQWLFLIRSGQQRLAVIGVAMGLNLRVIAQTFGCSHETIRQREKAGIAALVKALNA
jgi:DNA-directed RNA polymerase specialized sigma24 family protein